MANGVVGLAGEPGRLDARDRFRLGGRNDGLGALRFPPSTGSGQAQGERGGWVGRGTWEIGCQG